MKSLMIMIIAFFAVSAAYAQAPDQQTPQRDTTMQQQQQEYQDMTKIKTSELPEGVQTAILSPEYNGWQIRDAYRANDNSGFLVTLRKGSEEKSLTFDAEGNPMGEASPSSPEGQKPE